MIQWYPGLTCQWSWGRGWRGGGWRGGGKEEEEERAAAALNTGIILHRLTLSLHIMLKLSPGNVERQTESEREWEGSGAMRRAGGGALKGRYNDHTLLSHSPSLLSAPYSPASALASHSPPFLFFHSVPDVFFTPLFLSAFVLCVCHASAEKLSGRGCTHLLSLSLASFFTLFG